MSELLSSFPTLHGGYQFTISLDENSNIWSFGDNNNGKCGHDIKHKIIFPPKIIKNLNNIQFICCGACHTLCCDYDGKVFSFGKNGFGQLGLNISTNELPFFSVPKQINIPPITQISSGFYFSVCLSYDNELWSFGQNSNGELGIGHTNNSCKPLKINNLSNIDYIACGGHFTFCKTTSNQYYSWGKNDFGQLAQDNTKDLLFPHACNYIPDNILSIRGGGYHVLFLTSDGIVYSCGYNGTRQLGHGNFTSFSIPAKIESLPYIIKISCGYNHSYCIDIDNNLWTFGYNSCGQLGLGRKKNIKLPTKNELLKDIKDLSYNSDQTFIKTFENKIYSFGDNTNSQLGIKGNKYSNPNPIQVFKDKEDIWKTNIHNNNRVKSARK